MPTFRVRQLRSGEGAILSHLSNLAVSELPEVLPELFEKRVLLVGATSQPAGGTQVGEGLWSLSGEEARRSFSAAQPKAGEPLIWALFDELPSAEAISRCVADPLRPWDHERLGAVVYAQSGKRYAHQGAWFHSDEDRRRWVEAAVARLLAEADLSLPTGDVTLVLELPTDSTFEAEYSLRGKGPAMRIKRDFGNQGFTRQWWVERGEWKGEETRRPKRENAPLAQRLTQAVATVGIFVLSLPVSIFVFIVLLSTKLTAGSTSTSKATKVS